MKEEREGSSNSIGKTKSKAMELTPEQIQQQNILRLKGLSVMPAEGESRSNDEDDSPGRKDRDMVKYGLEGLLPLLKGQNNDIINLNRGIDINMMGLDLNNRQTKLARTFASPWLETSRSEVVPLFRLSESYKIDPMGLKSLEQRMGSFNDQTLFYIFYSKPRDIIQELAARQLNERNWKYHRELQVWLTKDPNSEPKSLGMGCEEGTYIFFDPLSWDYVTKTLTLYYNSLATV